MPRRMNCWDLSSRLTQTIRRRSHICSALPNCGRTTPFTNAGGVSAASSRIRRSAGGSKSGGRAGTFGTGGQGCGSGVYRTARLAGVAVLTAVTLTVMAVFYLRQLRIKDAEVVLEHSLNSAPSPQAYRLLGVIRLDQQRAQAAIRLFREATALAPRELAGWYYLGLAYQAISDTDSALMCYGQALQLDPKDFATHRQIGLANLDRGHAAEARDHLREASTLQPEDGEVAMYLSQAYLYAGDLENASESAKRAARLLPDDPRSHYQLGLVLARSEMMNESAKEFELSERLPRKLAVGPLERWRQLSEKRKRIVPDSDARP